MSKQKEFAGPTKCAHCGNTAPMEIVVQHSQVRSHEMELGGAPPFNTAAWEEGAVYQLLECPACAGVVLRRYYYHDGRDPDEWEMATLYPMTRTHPQGLPPTIVKGWEAAARVKQIDANAYAVLLRRVLELVSTDRGAVGKDLNAQLADLAAKGEIPTKLVDVSRGLRRLSNVGAHAVLGDLTPAEAPILEDLCRAVLEYVYSAPHLAQQAQERLDRLKTDGSSKTEP
jgi:hypothetical protein